MSCLGLISDNKNKITLAVWRRECDGDTLKIDMSKYLNGNSEIKLTYPQAPMGAEFRFDSNSLTLTVKLPQKNSARFFEIEVK